MTGTTVLPIGPLAPFHEAGVLDLADVHVAAGLMRIAGLSIDDHVALGAALCVRSLRQGSVCVDLGADPGQWAVDTAEALALPWPEPSEWLAAVRAHPMVAQGRAGPGDCPLRLVGDLLYLQRHWVDEELIRARISARARTLPADPGLLSAALARLFPGDLPDRQRLAAATAALRGVTFVVGGPGTGKTTTVARLLAVLREVEGPRLSIALAAPTGKAAARLQQAVAEAVATLDAADRARVGHVPASTVHRLLGWRPDSQGRFRHDRSHPLPHDVVVLDETSMVSATLMARLVDAVRPGARLVLVGDPDQLASVEAGAVLGDLVVAAPGWGDPGDGAALAAALAEVCPADAADCAGSPGVVELTRNWRFGGTIARLGAAIRSGDAETAVALLRGGHEDVEFLAADDATSAHRATDRVRTDVVAQAMQVHAAAAAGDAAAALRALDSTRVLCAHREGPYGAAHWGALIRAWGWGAPGTGAGTGAGSGAGSGPPEEEWYVGRPLLVTANDHEAGVYNGDTGVVIAGPDGRRFAAFGRGGEPLMLPPSRLRGVETLAAMTVHRGQGSQFDAVTVVLPPPESPLLTRELLYTAVTRARRHIRIIGTQQAVLTAIATPVRRASGLRVPAAL